MFKKKYIPYQDELIGVFSWLTTLLPLKMLMSDYTSVYINWGGEYGSIFNRTYPVNLFLVGGFIGGLILYVSPGLSRVVTKYRGKKIDFQGIIVTFSLLVLISLITQFIF